MVPGRPSLLNPGRFGVRLKDMPRELAIALTDSSLCACVAITLAHQKYRLVLIQIDTGELNQSRRSALFDQQVAHFKPYRNHTLKHDSITKPGKRDTQIVDPRAHDDLGQRLIGLLGVIARGIEVAAHYDATTIHLGLRVGLAGNDLARATEHLQIWNDLVQTTCGRPNIEIVAPLLEMDPWQVVDLGTQVDAPVQSSWDCELNQGDPCGTCGGCRWRETAFARAAKADPARQLVKN